ncbi:MAG: MBL fold metallo-hydrolase [Sandaracinaceae bacterium]
MSDGHREGDGHSEVFFDPFATGRWVAPKSGHFDGKRFLNAEGSGGGGGVDLIKWMTSRDQGPWRSIDNPPGEAPPERVDGLRVTFVGHATCLVQMAGLNFLTDPVYGERLGPVSFAGPKRFRRPGIRFEDLPPIDVVLLSHDHFDHLCEATCRRLAAAHAPVWVTGLGNRALLQRYGVEDARELDWWEATEVGDAIVTFVPAEHFSGRSPRDRDRTLWGGLVVKTPAGSVYFAGDTGMGSFFDDIQARLGPPDVALIPIGAFKPEWFMAPVHISPAQAVEAARRLGAKRCVPMHYGTFALADDGMDEPLEQLRAALTDDDPPFDVLEEGEGRTYV